MAGERTDDNAAPIAQGLKPDASALKSEKDMVSRKDGLTSDVTSPLPLLGDAAYGLKADFDNAEGFYYPPTSCYNYYYPGYNGSFNHLDDQGYLNGSSFAGIPSDIYSLPGYNPHNTGFISTDGEHPYVPSGYFHQPVSYGSDLQFHSGDASNDGDTNKRNVSKSDDAKSTLGHNGSVNSSLISSKTMNSSSTVPLNSKARKFTVSSGFSKSFTQAKPLKPLNKLGSGFQSAENTSGFYTASKFPGFGTSNQGFYVRYGPMNYQTQGRLWNANQRFKSRSNFRREGENEGLNELSRGPRASTKSDPSKLSTKDEQTGPVVLRDKCNSDDFPTEYENAKFFVIKSYSEDDIHKCVKYNVWSSTANGNKKLNTAYLDAEAKAAETGTKVPIFLFFSVNGSGQFLGVAEMISQVDFNKNMDFWQLDKWNGFFPVKWHIVKDLPNSLLRHIILENNENKDVTYSRDTQEVGLKQGLEMLSIFRSYAAKTSLVDDFKFYEEREKSLKARRSSKPALQDDGFKKDAISKHVNGVERRMVDGETKMNGTADVVPSLVSLTKDLSLNPLPLKSSA